MLAFNSNPPKPNEGVFGYLLRMAAENLRPFNDFLKDLGLNRYGRQLLREIDKVEDSFGLVRGSLSLQSPMYSPPLPFRNLSFERHTNDAVCVDCLRDYGVRHVGWRHRLIVACPDHGCLLLDHCPACGEALSSQYAHIFYCECGFDLRHATAVEAPKELKGLSAILVGRTRQETGAILQFEMCSVPSDFDLFVFQLACHAQTSNDPKVCKIQQPKTIEEAKTLLLPAAQLLMDWPTNFDLEVSRRIRDGDKSTAGLSSRLGSWVRVFNKRSDPVYNEFRKRIEIVGNKEFDGTYLACTNRRTIPSQCSNLISSMEAAEILSMSSERLRNAIDAGDVAGIIRRKGLNYRHAMMPRDEVERLRSVRNGFLCKRDSAAHLGVSTSMMNLLIEAGVVTIIPTENLPPLVDGQIRKDDLVELTRRIQGNANVRPCKKTISLSDLTLRHTTDKSAFLRLLDDVASGQLRSVATASKFGNIPYDKAEIDSYLRWRRDEVSWSVEDISRITGWKSHCIAQWCRQGLLQSKQTDSGRESFLITPQDLSEFQKRYVVLSDLAKSRGTSSKALIEKFHKHGVALVGALADGTAKRGYILELSKLPPIL